MPRDTLAAMDMKITHEMNPLELRLLNEFQRDFPLIPAPFREIAGRLGVAEAEVLILLQHLHGTGAISRVGAVFRPHTVGASTLAALAVPEDQLEQVAQQVNAYPEVNHNYEREHRYNLWFVVTASDSGRLSETLARIARETGYPPLILPMEEDFHIDLGFDLTRNPRGGHRGRPDRESLPVAGGGAPTPRESALVAAIQHGLPLVSRPFAEVGARAGMSEAEVLTALAQLLERGVIRRFGVVVRHHELGYRANAMVVWDIPDARVSEVGNCLGQFDFVTLCYRRPRRLPEWRYNLFSMIHGQDREAVLALVTRLRNECQLTELAHETLFSRRRFKQCGARYVEAAAA